MFGGDNQELYSDSPSASNVSPPENNNSEVQNGIRQHAETVINNSKELEDDLLDLRRKIKDHKENIKIIKRQNNKLDSSILEMEVAIEKHLTTSSSKEENDNPEHVDVSEEETTQQILKYNNSAAAHICNLTNETQVSSHFLVKDVVGVVALLGKVDDPNLSRLLSKYLGLQTMLAVVCKTYEGLKSLDQ